MTQKKKLGRMGIAAFFFSGICVISSGVVVSLLQEQYGFAYGMTGTLISLMNIGNLLASFAAGVLPARIGGRNTVIILCSGYFLGYLVMGLTGAVWALAISFLLVGIAKGCTLNNCTVLVGSNFSDKTKGLNRMHAGYAMGALLGPVLISLALKKSSRAPMLLLALTGTAVWLILILAKQMEKGRADRSAAADMPVAGAEAGQPETAPVGIVEGQPESRSFLHQRRFWLLTCLLFCQLAAEGSVTGWLVTYYKGNGLLSGTLSTYTMTVMWSATLIARLLIAFVFPVKNRFRTLAVMGIGCTLLYVALMCSSNGTAAIVLLFLFAFAMAGVNPTVVAGAGDMLSAASMAVMLPISGAGSIVMPWIIGIVAEHISLQAGMLCNAVPCLGILIFSLLCRTEEKRQQT